MLLFYYLSDKAAIKSSTFYIEERSNFECCEGLLLCDDDFLVMKSAAQ